MKTRLRIWLLLPLLLAGVLATSCEAERKKAIQEVATQYLDFEKTGSYDDQFELFDQQAAMTLPTPFSVLTNPFEPKRLTAYQIQGISMQGATAQAQVKATFQMVFTGGATGTPEMHDLTIYLVHEEDTWKVDEIKTRMAAMDTVIAPGSGNTWLMVQKQKRPPMRHLPGQ